MRFFKVEIPKGVTVVNADKALQRAIERLKDLEQAYNTTRFFYKDTDFDDKQSHDALLKTQIASCQNDIAILNQLVAQQDTKYGYRPTSV